MTVTPEVLHRSPHKRISSRDLKVLGQVVEKEMRHIFISLFLVQGRGDVGVTSVLHSYTGFTVYKRLKSLGNSYLKSLEFPM